VSDVIEAVYAGLDLGTSGCKGVLVTAGVPFDVPGTTNLLKVETV